MNLQTTWCGSENRREPSLQDKVQLSEDDAQELPVWAKKARVKGINRPRAVTFTNHITDSAMSSIAIDDMPEPFGKNSKSPPITAISSSIR